MKFFLTIITVFHVSWGWAQKEPSEFGNISMEEMKMTSLAADSSATAVVLFHKGETLIDLQSERGLTYKEHKRIKILKKEGFSVADVVIYFGSAGVSKINAVTYNLENGKIVESKLDEKSIFKTHIDKTRDKINFTFPNVKEGSVLEFSFMLKDDDAYIPPWNFQTRIWTLSSEYSLMVPPSVVFNVDLRGVLPVSQHETKYNDKYQKWVMKNVAPLREEPYMPDESELLSSVHFLITYRTWPEVNEQLLDNEKFFNGVTKFSVFWKNKVKELTAGLSTSKEKVIAISEFLKNNIKWDGTKDFYAADPDDILKARKGSSGDINLLFGSMLNQADVVTEFVLLSTGDHGPIRPAVSSVNQFNYVICRSYIDNAWVLLDATETYLPFDALPEYCLNRLGLVISKTNHGWMGVTGKTKAKTVVSSTFNITDSQQLTGKLSISNHGYDALETRLNYKIKGKDDFSAHLFRGKAIQIESINIQNLEELENAVKTDLELTLNEQAVSGGEFLYINPFIMLNEKENPFKSKERSHPVVFKTLLEKIYLYNLKLPEGYVVEELPQNKVIALTGNAGKYTLNVAQNGDQITLLSNFQINTPVFSPADYTSLREFYSIVIAKQAEQIVLRKK
jgi:hypothetical protein